MKKKKLYVLIALVFAISLVVFACAALLQQRVPKELRALGGRVVSAQVQDIVYKTGGAAENITRHITNYIMDNGAEYSYDESGNLIAYISNDFEETECADITQEQARGLITTEYVCELLRNFVPDIDTFEVQRPVTDGIGGYYDMSLKKNIGPSCRDAIQVSLKPDGTLSFFTLSRCGISDPTEIDFAYFESLLEDTLSQRSDTVIESDIAYMKIDGTICAFCTADLRDSYGGYYCEMYTFQ